MVKIARLDIEGSDVEITRTKTEDGEMVSAMSHRQTAKDKIWSASEKAILSLYLGESAMLDYPLCTITVGNGSEEYMYDIPKEDIRKVLADICPTYVDTFFSGCVLVDGHNMKEVDPDDIKVIRCNDRNMPVSPYYAQDGGMLVDIIPKNELSE